MKQVIVTLIGLAIMATTFAQDNPRPTKSRFWNSKYSTFTVKPGDILVYRVEPADGESYDLLVYVKQFGSSIIYDYDMPTKGKRNNVNLKPSVVNDGITYTSAINADNQNNRTFWLSKKNYRELASVGGTSMDFGNGAQQFSKTNTGTLKINYKGKPKIITLYNIKSDDGLKNNIGVLTDQKNPLMITMDTGVRMTLKEVR